MNKKSSYSLKFRLLKLLLMPIGSAIIIIGVFTFYNAYHETEEISDAQLSRASKVILSLVSHELAEHKFDLGKMSLEGKDSQLGHKYEKKLAYRVWGDEKLLLSSFTAKDFSDDYPDTFGFSTVVIKGEKWRIYRAYKEELNLTIEVAEKFEVREELIAGILLSIFIPSLLLIPVVVFTILYGVAVGLRPVRNIASEVEKRSLENLKSLEIGSVIPVELRPFVTSIDDLFERLNESIERERRFTDNAAHELRTPLAIIKTSAQVAMDTTSTKEKNEILVNLLNGVNRASRLIEQLLKFTRIESSAIELSDVDMSGLVGEIIKDYKYKASSHGIVLFSEIEDNILVIGGIGPVEILVGNLIDNAIKYSSTGSTVNVSLKSDGDKIIFTVVDHGRGISNEDKERIFERFFRSKSVEDTVGAGLGLAMVKWITDELGIALTLSDTEGGGLTVEAVFSTYKI